MKMSYWVGVTDNTVKKLFWSPKQIFQWVHQWGGFRMGGREVVGWETKALCTHVGYTLRQLNVSIICCFV